MWAAVDHPLVLGLLRVNQSRLAWEEWPPWAREPTISYQELHMLSS